MIILLIISTFMSAGFGLFYKIAVTKRCNLLMVNIWMFVGSLIGMLSYVLFSKDLTLDPWAAFLGVLAGISSCVATMSFFLHIKHGQLSASWTVINLSVGFPILASMLIWKEHPTTRQTIGLFLMLIALLLFGRSEWKKREVSS